MRLPDARQTQTSRAIDEAAGVQLQSLRVYAGLELASATQTLRLDPAELSAYEASALRPAPRTVLAMAECYGVAPSRVFDILARSARA